MPCCPGQSRQSAPNSAQPDCEQRDCERLVIIDARGRRCPLPILDLARAIRQVPIGETITVEADDPAARPDVAAWCRMRGHELLGETVGADGTPGYVVRRKH